MIHITPSAADIAAIITGSSRSLPLRILSKIGVQKFEHSDELLLIEVGEPWQAD